jgi:hypothetical protein
MPQPCGTEAAYRRHLAHQETPCEPCKQAHRDHDRRYRPTPTRFDKPDCGTVAGYRWHRKHGEPQCRPCKDALAAYARSRYGKAAGTQPGRELQPCGTDAAYNRHLQHSEEPCEPCVLAHRAVTAADAKARRIVAAMTRAMEG